MWYKLENEKPVDNIPLFAKLKSGEIVACRYDSTLTEYIQANFIIDRVWCESCGEQTFNFEEEITHYCYQSALEEMDKELDIVYECLIDLCNFEQCENIIKEVLDKIKRMKKVSND